MCNLDCVFNVSVLRPIVTWKQREVDGQFCREGLMVMLTFTGRGKSTKW